MVASLSALPTEHIPELHARFLVVVPKIQTHARIYFRFVRCADRRADTIAECVALAWKWYRRLAERGKDAAQFPMAFAFLVAKAVRCGRRICGMAKAKDVLNPLAQKRHGFTVEPLPMSTRVPFERAHSGRKSQQEQDEIEERLRDNTLTPPPEQAAFRIDFPSWLESLTGRERRMIRAIIQNERTQDLGKKFEVSPARISQLRREFCENWRRYVGEVE